jgi:hypothetical protein
MSNKCLHQLAFNWQSGLLYEKINRLGSEVYS